VLVGVGVGVFIEDLHSQVIEIISHMQVDEAYEVLFLGGCEVGVWGGGGVGGVVEVVRLLFEDYGDECGEGVWRVSL